MVILSPKKNRENKLSYPEVCNLGSQFPNGRGKDKTISFPQILGGKI